MGPSPEAIQPRVIDGGGQPTTELLTGTVTKASYLGSHLEYTIETEVGPLFVVDPRIDELVEIGRRVELDLAARGVMIVDE